jgi:hypothetical protein
MTTERRLPVFIAGLVLGAAGVCAVFVVAKKRSPAAPELRPATTITVTLHPWEGMGVVECVPVDIPPEQLDLAFRLLTPEKYFEGGVQDFIFPIVAEAVVTHADGSETRVLVRDLGHNPAVVTLDGRNYFYARNDPDVHAGAVQLVRLVNEVAYAKKKGAQPKP